MSTKTISSSVKVHGQVLSICTTIDACGCVSEHNSQYQELQLWSTTLSFSNWTIEHVVKNAVIFHKLIKFMDIKLQGDTYINLLVLDK